MRNASLNVWRRPVVTLLLQRLLRCSLAWSFSFLKHSDFGSLHDSCTLTLFILQDRALAFGVAVKRRLARMYALVRTSVRTLVLLVGIKSDVIAVCRASVAILGVWCFGRCEGGRKDLLEESVERLSQWWQRCNQN